MTKRKPRIYWDSVCFLGFFNNEREKIERCKYVVDKAQNREIEIICSAITLTEVVKMKGQPSLKKDQEEQIKSFFYNDFIVIVNVTESIAHSARQLIWEKNLDPKDSIHLASAIYHNIEELNTFDEKLIELSGKLRLRNENKNLLIRKPELSKQLEIEYESKTK